MTSKGGAEVKYLIHADALTDIKEFKLSSSCIIDAPSIGRQCLVWITLAFGEVVAASELVG